MSLLLDGVTVLAKAGALFAPVSIAMQPGEIVTLMGPSGSGKSSLLAHVCGTLAPGLRGEGRVQLDGRDLEGLPPERRRIGILFQDDLLFPHLSVGANLGFGLRPGPGRRVRIEAALADAELGGMADRDPATLSGGQRARVALLRTLLSEPRALLLDEPFSRLDAALRDRFRRFVFEHAAARHLPVLLVTHDPEDARAAGGAVVTLQSTPQAFAFDPTGPGASLALCEDAVARAFPDVAEIEASALVLGDDVVILDVRAAAEHAVSHIPGAIWIDPAQPAAAALARIPPGAFVVCACSVGLRSARLARALVHAGADPLRIANLRGGIFRWSRLRRALCNDRGATQAVHPFSSSWGRLLKS